MIGPGKMVDSVVNLGVRVACPLGSKLEYGPLLSMLAIEEFDQLDCRVSVGFLWPDRTGTRGNDNCELSANN